MSKRIWTPTLATRYAIKQKTDVLEASFTVRFIKSINVVVDGVLRRGMFSLIEFAGIEYVVPNGTLE